MKLIDTSPSDDEEIEFIVEPLPGHSDDEIVTALRDAGASDITILAPNFISAKGRMDAMRGLRSSAVFEPKRRKQMLER